MTKYMTQEIYNDISYFNKSEDDKYFIFTFSSQQILYNTTYFDVITTYYNLYELQFEIENDEFMSQIIFKFLKGVKK
jgi:hypothetical protein